MKRARFVLIGLVAVAAGVLAPPASAALEFDRPCSGKIDSRCYHDFCGIADCTRSDCAVYSGIFGDGNAGICVGKPRPRDPVS